MAKQSVNKSALVRDYLAKYPEKGPTAIAKQITEEKGVQITSNFVAAAKTKLKQASGSAVAASAAMDRHQRHQLRHQQKRSRHLPA